MEQILGSIGISGVESEALKDNLLIDKVQKNINMLHGKSEELTSRNLTLKAEIDKIKKSVHLAEVSVNVNLLYYLFIQKYII